ncbi:MAG: hypothetical protein HRU20_00860 [Pseudomonadales bacterium]|nr:hypothetical protein [Pseudomonadales bacterium]
MPASADVSATLTLASDYLFNGVSQTDEDPALQGSVDYSHDSGWYAGVWASNVDFGETDDTNLEIDLYTGFAFDINEQHSLDLGLAQYNYSGGNESSEANYLEAYAVWAFYNTEVSSWYAPDYAGADAGHVIVKLTQSINLPQDFSLLLGIDHSKSLDEEKFSWEDDADSYTHWQVAVQRTFYSVDAELSYHDTNLKTYGDSTVLLTLSHSFEF